MRRSKKGMSVATKAAHVVVLGNEKGGSGKSTTAFHIATLLLYQGFKVATLDVDSRQQTFTHYVMNRRNWAQKHQLSIPHSTHYHLPLASGDSLKDNAAREFEVFRRAVAEVENRVDFIVVDTPGFDTNLTRVAHSLADTLVTPINDSLIDLDVLGQVDPDTGEICRLSQYARLVQRARKQRLAVDGKTVDWALVRNRISMLSSRNMRLVRSALDQLALRMGARVLEGIAERVIFRSLFPIGMTVFDPLENFEAPNMAGAPPEAARREYESLVRSLNLPRMHRVQEREHARAQWRRASQDVTNQFAHMGQVPPLKPKPVVQADEVGSEKPSAN